MKLPLRFFWAACILCFSFVTFLLTYSHKRWSRIPAITPDPSEPHNPFQGPDAHRHGTTAQEELDAEGFTDMDDFMRNTLDWIPPPNDEYWPFYSDYAYTSYNPKRWEGLERENGYYFNSTIDGPNEEKELARPYLPYPKYNTEQWRKQWKGDFKTCEGPRGARLDASLDDLVYAFNRPESSGFPEPSVGGFEQLGLNSTICFDRESRYGAYGLKDREGKEQSRTAVDWDNVDWGRLQNQCIRDNAERYSSRGQTFEITRPGIDIPDDFSKPYEELAEDPSDGRSHQSRTAILIRSYEGYHYTENDIQSLRAMMTELSLFSGGEYTVVLLVQIRSPQYDIYNSEEGYQSALEANIPPELRSITVLWTEEACEKAYPAVGNWDVYLQQWMPVQWFAGTHPEFDFFWNWELDVRSIAHYYEFMERIRKFAQKQPRELLWERNKRFWLPSIHGGFAQWFSETNAKIKAAVKAGEHPEPVWGPQPVLDDQKPWGPDPPTGSPEEEWGVGEEADMITLLPIWEPRNTEWTFRNHVWNFVPGKAPDTLEQTLDFAFNPPELMDVQRRVSISTVMRLSRPLLQAMHMENKAGRSMQAEMWPSSAALHHGLKAVHAPHPIWFDRKWPAAYADAVFNAHAEDWYDGHDISDAPDRHTNYPAQWTERLDSPYNHDREWNFRGWSWYYRSVFAGSLYRRFLGFRTPQVHDTGESVETMPDHYQGPATLGETSDVYGGPEWEAEHGRICLPSMILHPIKYVVTPYR